MKNKSEKKDIEKGLGECLMNASGFISIKEARERLEKTWPKEK